MKLSLSLRALATLAALFLPTLAVAQPVCSPTAPSSVSCQSQAVNLQLSDVLLGTQLVGPLRANQSVKVSLSQVLNALPIGGITPSTGAFTTLSATSGGTLNGTFAGTPTFSGNTTFSASVLNTGGALTVGSNTFSGPTLTINGLAGATQNILFRAASVTRWRENVDSTTALTFTPFSDVGGSLGTLVSMTRLTGSIAFDPAAVFPSATFTNNFLNSTFNRGTITQNGTRTYVAGTALGSGGVNPANYLAQQTWTGKLDTGAGQEPWWFSINDQVDASGLSYNLTPFNITHQTIETAVPVAAGTGYAVGNIVTDAGGGTWRVATINGSGGILTLTNQTGGTSTPGAATPVTGGSGSSATITVTSADGPRSTFTTRFIKGAPSPQTDQNFVAASIFFISTTGEGGTGTTLALSKGVYKAINIDMRAREGADFLQQLQLGEMDLALAAGKHSLSNVGFNINLASDHGAEATYENSGWVVDRAPPSTAGTWLAFAVGSSTTFIPFIQDRNDTAIVGIQRNLYGNTGTEAMTLKMGRVIDGRFADCLQNCWESPGFKVNAGGSLLVGPGVLSFDGTNGLKIAAPNKVAVSAVPVSGGLGYNEGDTVFDSEYNQWTAHVAATVITSFSLLHASATGTCPSAASATFGGKGDSLAHPENPAATITVTCSTPLGVLVADTGQKLSFYGGSPISKATPSGACAGSTGCQALRDALGALGLINTGSISN